MKVYDVSSRIIINSEKHRLSFNVSNAGVSLSKNCVRCVACIQFIGFDYIVFMFVAQIFICV